MGVISISSSKKADKNISQNIKLLPGCWVQKSQQLLTQYNIITADINDGQSTRLRLVIKQNYAVKESPINHKLLSSRWSKKWKSTTEREKDMWKLEANKVWSWSLHSYFTLPWCKHVWQPITCECCCSICCSDGQNSHSIIQHFYHKPILSHFQSALQHFHFNTLHSFNYAVVGPCPRRGFHMVLPL